MLITANDRVAFSQRKIMADGSMEVPATLARTGIQTYLAKELGLTDRAPFSKVQIYRPEEEVFSADSMASFEGVPVTDNHPAGNRVTQANRSQVTKGQASSITREGNLMKGVLSIDAALARKVQAGKVEISNGYTFELDMTPGFTADGQPYDGVQRGILGNHVAVVSAGRCGSACRVADSQGDTMKKIVVDGIPVEVDDTTAAVIEKLQKQVADSAEAATAAAQKAEQDKAELVKAHDAAISKLTAELEAVRKDVMTPEARDAMVADWAKLIGDAKVLVPDLVTEGKTCHAIRQEVITKVTGSDAAAKGIADAVLGGKVVADAAPELVRAAFGALRAAHKPATQGTKPAADRALGEAFLGTKQTGDAAPLVGRAAFMARMTGAEQK